MEELLDELSQGIDTRVYQLAQEWIRQKDEKTQEEIWEQTERIGEMLNALPGEERNYFDYLLVEREKVSEEERAWFYRNGLADALDILRYLRKAK